MPIFSPFGLFTNSLDIDAYKFLNAVNITTPTIVNAINTLVIELKNNGLWEKMNAVYPFVGGSATTHKYNLKNPIDSDAAYRLSFNGGWTHNSNGVTGNGSNTYANTYLTPANWGGGTNNVHYAIYVRNIPTPRGGTDFGSNNGSNYTFFNARNPANSQFSAVNGDSSGGSVASTVTSAFMAGSRLSSTTMVLTQNLTQTSITKASVSSAGNTYPLYLGAYNNNNTPANYQDRQYSLMTLGNGLLDSEMDNLYYINQRFQTTLERWV